MSKTFVKTGDTVMVLSGKSKGVKGEVVAVSPKRARLSLRRLTLLQSTLNLVRWVSLAVLSKRSQHFMHQKFS